MARERIVEGRWACSSCGAQGILGRHKACPGCGNPREQGSETSFDFGAPTDTGGTAAETVTDAALLQLASLGADWHCSYCEIANRADAARCVGCGADRDEAQPREAPTAPPPLPLPVAALGPTKRRRWPWVLVAVVLSCCGFGIWAGTTHEVDGLVAKRAWERRVGRETFERVEKRGWRDELRPARAVMPVSGRGEQPGVEDVSDCQRKQRGTRQVPDGTRRVCTDRTRRVACGTEEKCRVVDQGNGFGKEVCSSSTKYCSESYEDCRNETQYRTEPVFGEECRYRTWEWREVEHRLANGEGDTPRWPELGAGRLDRITKAETYRVEVRYADDKVHVVSPKNETDFARWPEGTRVKLRVTNLGLVEEATPAAASGAGQ
jgi:hypothetical protein